MPQEKILIVDDDKIILDSLCEFLSAEGFQTDGAGKLAEAKKRLSCQNYNLVLTDVNLVDGDGFELLDIIKNEHRQPD